MSIKIYCENCGAEIKDGEKFYEVKDEIFTYNPGLRRKSDHDLFGPHEKLKDKLYEIELSKYASKSVPPHSLHFHIFNLRF